MSPLISQRVVEENPKLIIHKDWSLITRSGSIGRMAYTRPDMGGMACSEDVLRVAPDPNRILPGYLYAFLSSKFGKSLVVGRTYGAIIPHIEPHHIADLRVPRLGEKVETGAHKLMQNVAESRTRASELLVESQQLIACKAEDASSKARTVPYERPLINGCSAQDFRGRGDAFLLFASQSRR